MAQTLTGRNVYKVGFYILLVSTILLMFIVYAAQGLVEQQEQTIKTLANALSEELFGDPPGVISPEDRPLGPESGKYRSNPPEIICLEHEKKLYSGDDAMRQACDEILNEAGLWKI